MGGGDLQKYNFLNVVYQRVVIPKKNMKPSWLWAGVLPIELPSL